MKCPHEPFEPCNCMIEQKFPKPGKKEKKKLQTKRLLKHNIEKPENRKCVRCGLTTGSECYRHLETFRKHEAGKGVGVKCDDKCTSWLCNQCDWSMSKKPDKNVPLAVYVHAEEWNWLIIKTHLL